MTRSVEPANHMSSFILSPCRTGVKGRWASWLMSRRVFSSFTKLPESFLVGRGGGATVPLALTVHPCNQIMLAHGSGTTTCK